MNNLFKNLSILILTLLDIYYCIILWIYQFLFNLILIILKFICDILFRICEILDQINELFVKSLYIINAKIFDNIIPVYFIKKLNFTNVSRVIKDGLNEIT